MAELQDALNAMIRSKNETGFAQVFSLRHDFSSEWYSFLTTPGAHNQAFTISRERFPFWLQGRTITINQIDLFGSPKPEQAITNLPEVESPPLPSLKLASPINKLFHVAAPEIAITMDKTSPTWELKLRVLQTGADTLKPLENILMVCSFIVEP